MSETITKKTDDTCSDGKSGISVPQLPSLTVQAERLIATGLLDGDGDRLAADVLRVAAADLQRRVAPGALLVVSEKTLPARTLVPHVRRTDGGRERQGFIVVDMDDVDDFAPTPETTVPHSLVYTIEDPRRGDELRNWSPAEAQEELSRRAHAIHRDRGCALGLAAS